MLQTSTAVSRVADQAGELLHAGARQAGTAARARPTRRLRPRVVEVRRSRSCARSTKVAIVPAVLDQDLEHAVEERDVAAVRDAEPVVGDVGAEQRAPRRRRHPVALHARLAVGIDQDDLGAARFASCRYFIVTGWSLAGLEPKKTMRSVPTPVAVAAGRGRDAERALHRAGRRRVAEARGVVDVVGAEEARDLLRHVVDLVRDRARGEVEGDARAAWWRGCARRCGRRRRPR